MVGYLDKFVQCEFEEQILMEKWTHRNLNALLDKQKSESAPDNSKSAPDPSTESCRNLMFSSKNGYPYPCLPLNCGGGSMDT